MFDMTFLSLWTLVCLENVHFDYYHNLFSSYDSWPLNYYSLLLFKETQIIVNEVISFDSLVGKPTLG